MIDVHVFRVQDQLSIGRKFQQAGFFSFDLLHLVSTPTRAVASTDAIVKIITSHFPSRLSMGRRLNGPGILI